MPNTLSSTTVLNDRYAVERVLGAGGPTITYAARDLKDGGRVVLRVLRRELTAVVAAEEFLHGARLVAGLQHSNILPIVDFGVARGVAGEEVVYAVSPYIDGGSLRDRLERQPQLPLDEVLRIAGGVASALDFAHRRNLVHEAVKPENILFRDGEPLVDFGVGLGLGIRTEGWQPDPKLTARAAMYMSPEQLSGQPVDTRADQYGLAAMVYEMLTGRPPFTGPTAQVIALLALAEPPLRLTGLRVVPRVVERAVHRALAKSPTDRFRSVSEFVSALHGASATPSLPPPLPPHASSPAPVRRRWRAAAFGSVLVLMVAAGVAMASRAVVNRRAASPAAHRQLTFSGTATTPALSPDGRSVAYVAGGRSLVLQRLDGGSALRLVSAARVTSAPRWTGDGRSLVVAMTQDSAERPATYLIPAAGGPARKVLDDWRPFDTGPDSMLIMRASRERGGLEIVSLASGQPTRLVPLPDSIGAIGEVAWSPDRRWIAFTDANNVLAVVAFGGGAPSVVARDARRIRWAAGSDALYFLSGPSGAVDLMRVGVDRQTGRAVGAAARVTSLLAADAFDVAAGRLVHTQTSSGARAQTFVLDGAPRGVVEERPLDEGTARVSGASVSPDGRWVAYAAARGAQRDIHVVAFAGGSARVLVGSPAREEAPTWSPDGSRITFAVEDSTGRRVVMADARSGVGQRVGSLPGPGVAGGDSVDPRAGWATARWSASGRHIVYYAQDLRRIAIVNLQRQNESVVRLPESVGAGYFSVIPSPNGTQLLASTRARGEERATLWLVFGNGRRWRRIPGPFGETFPVAWHRNGWVYLVRNRAVATDHGSVHLELWRMRGPLGRAEYYAPLPEGCGIAVSISADATRGVCSYVRVESDLYVASSFGGAGRVR